MFSIALGSGQAIAQSPAAQPAPNEFVGEVFTGDSLNALPRKRLLRRGRFELSPLVSLTLNDPYYQHFAATALATYYVRDALGLGLGFDYFYVHAKTSKLDDVRVSTVALPPDFRPPNAFLHASLTLVPFYGKLSLFETFLAHFDTYLAFGLGTAVVAQNRFLPAANVALGQHYSVTNLLSLRLEVRTHAYLDRYVVSEQVRSDIQTYVMLMLGASFFVP